MELILDTHPAESACQASHTNILLRLSGDNVPNYLHNVWSKWQEMNTNVSSRSPKRSCVSKISSILSIIFNGVYVLQWR